MHSLNFGYSKKGDKDRRYGHIETKWNWMIWKYFYIALDQKILFVYNWYFNWKAISVKLLLFFYSIILCALPIITMHVIGKIEWECTFCLTNARYASFSSRIFYAYLWRKGYLRFILLDMAILLSTYSERHLNSQTKDASSTRILKIFHSKSVTSN